MCARKKRSPPPSFATIRGTWESNPYCQFFHDMLDSPAYIALSSSAKEAYTILREEYKGPFSGSTIKCTYATFKRKGMRANTVSRALIMLEIFGFIKVEHGGLEHQPNKYTFSDGWKEIRTDEDVRKVLDRFNEVINRKKKVNELMPC